MKSMRFIIVCGTALSLAACAGTPGGPTVQVMPPPGKPFEQFASEQETCKQYAAGQVQGEAENANNMGILEGVGGTALGAGLGAAIGGGRGAAIGAGAGALGGTAVGSSTSSRAQGGIQQQYNNAFVQCMVAKGNLVPRPPAPRPPPTVIYQAPPAVIYQAPPPVIYQAPPPPPPGAYPPPY